MNSEAFQREIKIDFSCLGFLVSFKYQVTLTFEAFKV